MIEKEQFTKAFRHISDRFNLAFNPDQAAAYYQFLSQQMDTDQFLRAARSIWANAKWFPRPADFLTIAAGDEWMVVLRSLDAYHPPDWKWVELYQALSERAKAACLALGGVPGMKPQYDKDPIRLKTAWEAAYEQATTSATLALPPSWEAGPLLPCGARQIGVVR